MQVLSWLKRMFSKKQPEKLTFDFSNYDRIQDKLMQQELALLKQELPEPSPRRIVWTQEMITEWRENARRVQELYLRQHNVAA